MYVKILNANTRVKHKNVGENKFNLISKFVH